MADPVAVVIMLCELIAENTAGSDHKLRSTKPRREAVSVTSTPVYSAPCPRCYSIPCRCPQTTTRIDPYFVYERIAAALERVADAMEAQNTESRPQ